MSAVEPSFRPARPADSQAVFDVFLEAVVDLGNRLGVQVISGGNDPATLPNLWNERRPLFEHLAATAAHAWVAERDGALLGYGRSTLRDGVLELTELFVRPGAQSAGVGRGLLARAFPKGSERRRVIVATPDVRAVASYLRAGVYARFPSYYFGRKARAVEVPTDLACEPLAPGKESLERLARVDVEVLGFRRDRDHAWLLGQRQGWLYHLRGGDVGYGYTGKRCGPFAVTDPGVLPGVLAHAERAAASRGDDIGLEVPLVNQAAVDYLLGEQFRIESFANYVMSDAPFGHFDRYLLTSPSFFL
jgi:ribosomal protein S18 acetylase RimI-like enzyme